MLLRASERFLSRRPGHGTAAEEVDMEVIHGLSAVVAGVNDDAVALAQAFFAGYLGGDPDEVTEQSGVMSCCLGERGDVFARQDEDVYGRLRVDVREGIGLLIFIDGNGWDASLDDFAEKAAHDGNSVQDSEEWTAF
jgi:hypothetical protein